MRKIAFLPVFLLACLSCSPPFDADIGLAALNLSRLTYQSTVDTGIRIRDGSPAYDAVFMPVKAPLGTLSTIDPSRGFVLLTTSTDVSLMFVAPDGNGGYVRVPDPAASGPVGLGTRFGKDPHYPGFDMRTVPDGTYAAVFSYDSFQPIQNSLTVMRADTSAGTLTQSVAALTFAGMIAAIMLSPEVIGAQYVPSSSIGGDGMFWLARDSGGYIHEISLNTVNFSGFSGVTDLTPGGIPLSFSLMFAGLSRVLYYHDPSTGVSYASFSAGGAWQCWRWEAYGANARQIPGITCRIDALLTTGELLSTQDGVGRLFDPEGKLLTTFPFGALRYSVEAYMNGTAVVFLSRSVVTHGSLSLELYSLPTARLRSLSY